MAIRKDMEIYTFKLLERTDEASFRLIEERRVGCRPTKQTVTWLGAQYPIGVFDRLDCDPLDVFPASS